MYQVGRPANQKRPKKFLLLELIVLMCFVGAVLLGAYWFLIKKSSTTFNNNAKPLITKVRASSATTIVDEAQFHMELPGTWKESSRDQEPGYHEIVWDDLVKGGISRWLKVYVDGAPPNYAVNYVIPATVSGAQFTTGPMSGNCIEFTPGANKSVNMKTRSVRSDQSVLSSSWQQSKFMCDNSHILGQRVGVAGVGDGLNSVTLTGPAKGKHKYFIVYDDSNYNPDYTIFSTILDTFESK